MQEVTIRSFNKGLKNRFFYPINSKVSKTSDRIFDVKTRAHTKISNLLTYTDRFEVYEAMSIHDAGIGSTFGASPISCAAALGVLEVFDKDDLLNHTKKQATMMNESLNLLMNESPFIGDVRGYGTMLGVEIVEDQDSKKPGKEIALKIIDNCKNNGLLLVNCGLEGNVIRFMGPLTTPLDQVEEALNIFNKSVINI